MKINLCFSWRRLAVTAVLTIFVFVGSAVFGSSLRLRLFTACLLILGGFFNVKISAAKRPSATLRIIYIYILYVLSMVAAAAVCVIVTQKVNDGRIFLSAYKFFLGAEIALSFICFICALEALITKKLSTWGIIISSALLLLLGLANYFLYIFRGNALSPLDFLTLGTAVKFAGNYEYEFTRFMFNGVSIYLVAAFFLSGVKFDVQLPKIVRSLCPAVLCGILLFSLSISFRNIESHHHANSGCYRNGLLLNFALETKESIIAKPAGYSARAVNQIEDKYINTIYDVGDGPNIIVIANESFADHRIYGDPQTNIPILPFFDSLEENTIKGYALTSVYGGMTPNSEFEVLTGNTMGFLPAYAVPFQQYISGPVFSLEHYLQSLGYISYAAHPAEIESWSRFKIYPYLGFDTFSFNEAFTNAKLFDSWVSDQGLYEHIIEKYESMDNNSSKFIYALTMQNHSPFEIVDGHSPEVSSEKCSSIEADVFFSRIHESDRAFGELVEYFESVDEPVVILLFGDHQPALPEDVLLRLRSSEDDGSLDSQMLRYVVPFVLWTNYEIEEDQVELTSLNFLSNYLLEAANLPLSPYNKFLKDVQEIVPAINAHGYYSLSEGRFKTVDEAEGAEKEILQEYARLQYNALFDKNNRSSVFFPTAG